MSDDAVHQLISETDMTDAVMGEASNMDHLTKTHHAVKTGQMDRICQCDDCKGAIEASYRFYRQLKESGHCQYWISQIAFGLEMMMVTDELLEHVDIKELTSRPDDEKRIKEIQLLQVILHDQHSVVGAIMMEFIQNHGTKDFVGTCEKLAEERPRWRK